MNNNTDFKTIYEKEKVNNIALRDGIAKFRFPLISAFDQSISGGHIETSSKTALDAHFAKTLDYFAPLFTKADILALYYQKLYHRSTIAIILLSALAVIVVVSQGLLHILKGFMYLEALFMVLILAIMFWGNRAGLKRKWRDYRFLAERLRIATYTALVGFEASRHYAEIRISEISSRAQWTVQLFHELWDRWSDTNKSNVVSITNSSYYPALKAFMLHAWLADQQKFHKNSVKRNNRRHKLLSTISSSLFIITLIVALFHWYQPHGMDENLLTFLAVCFPVCASAATALREHFEFNKIARRSDQIVAIIGMNIGKLSKIDDRDKARQICMEAERIFINEISDWHVLVGYHELEIG